MVMVTSLTNER